MSAAPTALLPSDAPAAPADAAAARVPATSFLTALLASFAVYFAPRAAARRWLGVSLPKAAAVAVVHLLAGLLWLWFLTTAVAAWQGIRPSGFPEWNTEPHLHFHSLGEFFGFFSAVAGVIADANLLAFRELGYADRFAGVAGGLLCTSLVLAVLFFMLLPFAARPGASKACARHSARAVLLGLSAIHFWGLAFTAAFVYFFFQHYPVQPEDILSPLFALFCGLVLWNLLALVRAVGIDYRRPADLPQTKEPLCENCGYNLTMAPADGRCPECGRPIADSLSPDIRAGTPWERRASLGVVTAVASQLRQLVRAPRALFFQTPTLTGQRHSQRWLVGSLLAIGLAAAWIVPGFYILDYLTDTRYDRALDLSWRTFWGSLTMAIIWALLGLMMVGIETAGVAAFSRMKGHPVPLGASSKVTAFAAPLMLAWVLLGGVQLLVAYRYNAYLSTHLSLRAFQVYLAASLAIAHIGGLLWFEFTVYRGVRSIQYANK
jgi:hypothetical protein